MSGERRVDPRLAKVVSDVQIPLDNLVYTIEAYLHANGARLDTETRFLLAGVRDCADRVAGSVRKVACQPAGEARPGTVVPLGIAPNVTCSSAPGGTQPGARLTGSGPGRASAAPAPTVAKKAGTAV